MLPLSDRNHLNTVDVWFYKYLFFAYLTFFLIPTAANAPQERMRSVIHKAAWPLSPVFGETAVVSAIWTSKFAYTLSLHDALPI